MSDDTTKPTEQDSTAGAIRSALPAMAAATGARPPGDGCSIPTVSLDQPAGALCREVAMILRAAPIFRFCNNYVTVNGNGEIEPMGANRFRSWVEAYMGFVKALRNGERSESIGHDKASVILASDSMRKHVREVLAVNAVRLPIWRGVADDRSVELLPVGYDDESRVFTSESVSYPDDMPATEAVRWLLDLLGEFPWYETDPQPEFRRSLSATVAAMMGVFGHMLFSLRPMVLVNGNQSGSGKSKLARIILGPVHGALAEDDKPKGDEELRKKLDSVAIDRAPYLFLDDLRNLNSNALNRFITSPIHAGRTLGEKTRFKEPNVTQVVATGNGVNVTEDLERRALIIDLFTAEKATKRQIRRVIDDGWLQTSEFRSQTLAALWSILRSWQDAGCHTQSDPTGSTFREYRELIGGVVTGCGFCDPFAVRECVAGGDESARALESVLCHLAADEPADAESSNWNTDVILERAEELGLTETIVPFAKDEKKMLGHRLRKLRGRKYTATDGRRFEFGKRDVSAGASYPVSFFKAGS